MQESSKGHVVELAIFKVKDGVSREQLLETADGVAGWARNQAGFISRDLTYSAETDTWIDVVWWESLAAAHAASEAALTSESCAPMFGLIDLEGTQMIHGTQAIPPVRRASQAA